MPVHPLIHLAQDLGRCIAQTIARRGVFPPEDEHSQHVHFCVVAGPSWGELADEQLLLVERVLRRDCFPGVDLAVSWAVPGHFSVLLSPAGRTRYIFLVAIHE